MEKYVPALREIDPEAGEWLRIHIKNKFEKNENPYHLAREQFMKERGITEIMFRELETEYKDNYSRTTLSEIQNVAQAIAKKTNFPFNKAQAFVSWVIANKWEELTGKNK